MHAEWELEVEMFGNSGEGFSTAGIGVAVLASRCCTVNF